MQRRLAVRALADRGAGRGGRGRRARRRGRPPRRALPVRAAGRAAPPGRRAARRVGRPASAGACTSSGRQAGRGRRAARPARRAPPGPREAEAERLRRRRVPGRAGAARPTPRRWQGCASASAAAEAEPTGRRGAVAPTSGTGWPPPRSPPGRARWRPGWRCAPRRSGPARSPGGPTAGAGRRGRARGRARPPPPARQRRAAAAADRPGGAGRGRVHRASSWSARWPWPAPAGPRPSGERAERGALAGGHPGVASSALLLEQAQLTDSVHRDEVARAEQRLRIDALRQRAVDELGLEPDVLVEEYGPHQPVPPSLPAPGDPEPDEPPQPAPYDRAEQEKRLRAAERALALLGTVNPLALEEFAALEERHTFLDPPAGGPQGLPPRPAGHRPGGRRAGGAGVHRGVPRHRARVRGRVRPAVPRRRGPAGADRPVGHAGDRAGRRGPPARQEGRSGCRCCPAASGR